MLLMICALLPAVLGAALPMLRIRSRRGRMVYAAASICAAAALAGYALFSGDAERVELFRLSDRFVCAFHLDSVGKIYLALAAVLWPPAMLYAVEYMRHEPREGHFFSWYLTAFCPVILLSAAENLFTLYLSYELLTLCTVPLVWHKQDEESTRAALYYVLFLFGGAALGLIAMVGLNEYGVGAFGEGALTEVNAWTQALTLLGFLGFGVKAAVFPLCRWLPKASVAPTPVTALLHALAVVNAGVLAVTRFLYQAVGARAVRQMAVWPVMMALSALTIVYGAVMAVREQHLKRRLAWSTVSNLSYMLFDVTLMTASGMKAGLAHMVYHGLMKSILFFCIGAVMTQTGRTQVRQMRGLGRKMPVTFLCLTLSGVSLLGVPPLGGFVSKYALVSAAFEEGTVFSIAGAAALLIAAVLTAVYIFTIVYPAFFMALKPTGESEETPCDPGVCMKASLLILSALLILASVFADPITAYLTNAAGGGIG